MSGITKIDSLESPIPLWITFPSPVNPKGVALLGRAQARTISLMESKEAQGE